MSQPTDPAGRREVPSTSLEAVGGEACASNEVWIGVAAGTVPQSEAMILLLHAGKCERCSNLLRSAVQSANDDGTEEDQMFLNQLSTGTEEGQLRLAGRLYYAAGGSSDLAAQPARSKSKLHRLLPLAGLAVAAALLIVFFVYRALRPTSDMELLARAYDKHRPSELRFPGSHVAPLASPTRGNSNQENVSSELLKVKLRAQDQFEKKPNDATVRETLGRIALVEHYGEEARRQFEMAQALDPNLPDLKFNLATAYLEIGESTGDPLDYARCSDLYGQYLESVREKDSVALYNRGLCWERQSVLFEAIKDYEAALALEEDSAWRREIELHLDKVRKLDLGTAGPDSAREDLTPAGFLQTAMLSPKAVDSHYELYLDAAMRGWIKQRATSLVADEALKRLAAFGLNHQDAWLRDWQRIPSNPVNREADQQLSAAVLANASGDSASALSEAEKAISLYEQANDQPGLLRARLEKTYSLQRTLRAEDCLHEGQILRKDSTLNSYSWNKAYLLLELSACESSKGDFVAGIKDAKAALSIASTSNLTLQDLRARFFIAEPYSFTGNTKIAWRMETEGLARSVDYGSAYRSYGFLHGMSITSSALGLQQSATGLAEAAADAAQRAGSIRDYAYSLEQLGNYETAIGHKNQADEAFSSADKLLPQMGSPQAAELFKADWEADRAVSLAHQDQLQKALRLMDSARSVVLKADAGDLVIRYYTELSDLFRSTGDSEASLQNSLLSVTTSEHTLAFLRGNVQKRSFETRNGRAYQLLVQNLIDAGEPEYALRVWEWYKVAGFRSALISVQKPTHLVLPAMRELPQIPEGTLVLVFAKVLDHYIVWSVKGGSKAQIREVALNATPERITDLASAFSRLCADRDSSLADLSLLGSSIYQQLLGPFEMEMHNAPELRLELDDTLRTIPFAALRASDGRYVAEEHSILELPSGWSLHVFSEGRIDHNMKLLVVNGTASAGTLLPSEYDETGEIASQFSHSVTLGGQDADAKHLRALLPLSEVFHYSGHGSSDSEKAGLVLKNEQELFGSDAVSGLSLQRCRLVVLAACETDSASPSDVDNSGNLPSALLDAGVSYVVATQWAIDSKNSKALMLQFYSQLSKKQTIPIALQAAQRSFFQTPSNHPYYWAAFRAFGE